MGLLSAEIRKLRTIRTTWILTGVAALWIALMGATYVLESSFSGEFVGTVDQVAAAIDQIGSVSVFVLVVAILAMTTEFRHGTIGRTLQITPERTRVLVVKAAAGALYAVMVFVVGLVVVAALIAIRALGSDVTLTFGPPVWTSVWQGIAALALTAAFGVALGALLRSQVLAVTLALVWMLILESAIWSFWPSVGKWFPFQAMSAVFVSDEVSGGMGPNLEVLEPGVGLAVFIGYLVVIGGVAIALLRHRDV